MKSKKTVFWIGLLILVFVALFFWQRSKAVASLPGATDRPSAGKAEVLDQAAGALKGDKAVLGKRNADRRSAITTDLPVLNDREIVFYGKAVDQFNQPVAGAEVQGTVGYDTGSRAGIKKIHTQTNAEGYFEFSGERGESLGIRIEKAGYEYGLRNSSFWYSLLDSRNQRHRPDAKQPVIFVLWKKQGAEPLVHYNKTFWEVPADGQPVKINLATGKVGGADADMAISIKRTPLRIPYGEVGYAWSAQVEIAGGGLLPAGEQDYYNLAPESGYMSRFEHRQDVQNMRSAQEGKIEWTWRGQDEGNFFIRSLDGRRHARVRWVINSADNQSNGTHASLTVTVWLNPSGSRNLEFDPAKVIAP